MAEEEGEEVGADLVLYPKLFVEWWIVRKDVRKLNNGIKNILKRKNMTLMEKIKNKKEKIRRKMDYQLKHKGFLLSYQVR
jgi:uncharacterized membrane protein (DUF106 family)